MGIESFLKRWTIQDSTTTVIAANDKLHIERVGGSPKVKFRCESPNSGTVDSWSGVKDCRWRENGGPAGHLEGTISDSSGGDFPLVITYAEGTPNRIHITVAAMPGDVAAMAHGGGGAGGIDD